MRTPSRPQQMSICISECFLGSSQTNSLLIRQKKKSACVVERLFGSRQSRTAHQSAFSAANKSNKQVLPRRRSSKQSGLCFCREGFLMSRLCFPFVEKSLRSAPRLLLCREGVAISKLTLLLPRRRSHKHIDMSCCRECGLRNNLTFLL